MDRTEIGLFRETRPETALPHPSGTGHCHQPAGTEGGQWRGSEAERRALLEEALSLGADFIDVELAADPAWRRELWARRGQAKIILSWHDFSGTPDTEHLEEILQKMLAQDADVIKMVALAQQPEDNLRLLSLIPQALARGREIIAFGMGPAGKWSRVAAPLLGSFLTFAPFSKKGASAPGQLTVNEVKRPLADAEKIAVAISDQLSA